MYPVAFLSEDLWLEVFKHVPDSLGNVRLVCKLWRRVSHSILDSSSFDGSSACLSWLQCLPNLRRLTGPFLSGHYTVLTNLRQLTLGFYCSSCSNLTNLSSLTVNCLGQDAVLPDSLRYLDFGSNHSSRSICLPCELADLRIRDATVYLKGPADNVTRISLHTARLFAESAPALQRAVGVDSDLNLELAPQSLR